MKDYFELQYIMINRRIKETGLNPFLGYVLGLTAFFLLSEYIFYKTDFAKYLAILTCLSLQFKLSERNRTDFLLSNFGNKAKKTIRVLENSILCVPFVAILLYKSFFFEAGILFLCSIILALVSFHTNINLTIPTPFSKRPFEFSTGFRKTFLIFIIAYSLTIIAIYVNNLNLGIFAFLLVLLTSLSYYNKPEQKYYVWVHAETPQYFLKNKIFNASKNVILIGAPIIIILLVFYPSEFELILLFFMVGLLFLYAVILAKYSVYPNEMSISEGVIIATCVYFPFLLLAIIPFFYLKSVKKLRYLLR
ncbi:ABC transporter permease [Riemerella anatipestifer]|uniref:ABC transporter permease n=1 Tax=Riemerella anatipestifer TaxID=34085 RepID=UPI00129D4904|nr:ABC transporter permease [Riemerella anatipestifer]MDY3344078.1 ABC transporter permease [Riemerella anatipestifer]MDY3357158.1 ABC transporter permease [Riemerella anatipestifer]